MAEAFIDTNVLLYAISTSQADQKKRSLAQQILQNADWAWSTLIQARGFLEMWRAFPMHAVDERTVFEAIEVAQRFQISYFDAQIVAAAKRLGCKRIYTEDLNHLQDYGGVAAFNPFV